MVRDLNFPLEMRVCATVREKDGLAMSSRNRGLWMEERKKALVLRRALDAADDLLHRGEVKVESLKAAMGAVFAMEPEVTVEYAEVVDPVTLLPVEDASGAALVAVAAKVGAVRLIDNLLVEVVR